MYNVRLIKLFLQSRARETINELPTGFTQVIT